MPLKASFVVAYDNGEFVGALGFDINLNLNKAKVCGPFVKYLDKYPFLAENMWLAQNEDMPAELGTFEILVNENNFSIRQLLLKLQANEVKRMLFTKAMKESIEKFFMKKHLKIQSDVHPFHKSFCNFLQIEEEQWIKCTSTLNEEQKLFFYIDEEQYILGYAFVRIEPIHYVGEIHHFTFQSLSSI